MSESNEQPAAAGTSPEATGADGPKAKPETPPSNQNGASTDDFIAELKRGLEKTRLSPELRAEILASQPPPEEMERLYREMIEQGGLSSEEFFTSLGLEVKPQP